MIFSFFFLHNIDAVNLFDVKRFFYILCDKIYEKKLFQKPCEFYLSYHYFLEFRIELSTLIND